MPESAELLAPSLAPVPWDEVERCIRAGVGVRETARRMGLDEERVKKQSTRMGWASNAPQARLNALATAGDILKAELVPNVPTASQTLAATLADDARETRRGLAKYARRGAEHAASLAGKDALDAAPAVAQIARTASVVHGWQQGAGGQDMAIMVESDGACRVSVGVRSSPVGDIVGTSPDEDWPETGQTADPV